MRRRRTRRVRAAPGVRRAWARWGRTRSSSSGRPGSSTAGCAPGRRPTTTSPLDALPGTLTALVGPSGSGKSTVLHALAGFLRATDPAAVRVAGPEGVASAPADLTATDLAATLAWVPQWSSSTIVATTVLDEVLATSRALGSDDAATKGRARALLTTLGLLHLQKADPRHLSGGEQRRLAVAAALLHGPAVLLADEPTVGQDRRTWAAIVGLVAAYRSAGGAVVAATHDTHVVDRATDVEHLAPPPQPPDEAPTRVPLVARCGPLAYLAAAPPASPAAWERRTVRRRGGGPVQVPRASRCRRRGRASGRRTGCAAR